MDDAPKKKGMPGCFVALFAFAGVVMLSIVVGAVLVGRYLSTPEGKKIAHFVGDTAKLIQEAQHAPGAKEMRDLGCKQAMVIDVDRMAELVQALGDGGAQRPPEDRLLLSCSVGVLGDAPGCDALARAYVGAVPEPKGRFLVQVQRQGGGKPECAASYAIDGSRIR